MASVQWLDLEPETRHQGMTPDKGDATVASNSAIALYASAGCTAALLLGTSYCLHHHLPVCIQLARVAVSAELDASRLIFPLG